MHIGLLVTGRFYDRAAALPQRLELPEGATLDTALAALAELLGPLPPTGLLSISGAHVGTVARHADRPLDDEDELAIVAPVAGG